MAQWARHFTSSNSGWWYTYLSEKYEFVSWDDDIPNIYTYIYGTNSPFMFQTTNQNYIKQRQQQIKRICQPIKLPGLQTPGQNCALLPSWAARGLRLPYLVG